MTVLSFRTASGKEVRFGEGRLKFIEASGLECPPCALAISEGPAVDGAIAVNAKTSARMLSLNAILDLRGLDEAQEADARRDICEALENNGEEGKVTVSRAGRTRWIQAIPSKAPEFTNKAWNENWQKLKVGFICGRPYFMDENPITVKVKFYEEMTEFSEEGIEFGEEGLEVSMILYLGKRIATIVNSGNIPTPVKIRFTGPIVNPFLRNATSGETIRIPQVIKEEEYIEIETTPGKREITLCQHGTLYNGMHYLDLSSKFWKLLPGENVVEIGDESPGEGSEASFEFYPHYREA